MQDLHQTGENIDPIIVMALEVEYLTIHARKYRSPISEKAKCLVESLFLLTLGQDFIVTSRTDGKLSMHDM